MIMVSRRRGGRGAGSAFACDPAAMLGFLGFLRVFFDTFLVVEILPNRRKAPFIGRVGGAGVSVE